MYAQRTDIKDLTRGRWKEILSQAGVPETALCNQHGPCPMCGGTDRYRFDDKNGTGSYFCNGCGPGDGFKLLMGVTGDSFSDAANWIRGLFEGHALPVQPIIAAAAVKESEYDWEAKRALAKKVWDESLPIEGSLAEVYLTGRGLFLPQWPKTLRFHPAQQYWEQGEKGGKRVLVGTFPAMVAAAVNPAGELVTLHRTYLAHDGRGKAPVADAKKPLSKYGHGACVRLAKPKNGRLAIAEGIENAIAVMMEKGIPCWPTLNSSLMKTFVVPEGVEELDIYGDNDAPDINGRRAGNDAMNKCAEVHKAKGIIVRKFIPTSVNCDFGDIFSAPHGGNQP